MDRNWWKDTIEQFCRYRKRKVKTVNDVLVKDRRQLYMSLQTGSPGLDWDVRPNVQSDSVTSEIVGRKDKI